MLRWCHVHHLEERGAICGGNGGFCLYLPAPRNHGSTVVLLLDQLCSGCAGVWLGSVWDRSPCQYCQLDARVAAGTPLVIAARIASALSAEFDDGDPPSGLKGMAEKEAAAAARNPRAAVIEEPGFVGWIEGWERGNEASFKHVSEIIQLSPNDEPHRSTIARLKAELGEAKYQEWYRSDADEQWRANAARLQAMAAQEVLDNAVGKLTVNISLGIRRAL